jgi:hypothetical protein
MKKNKVDPLQILSDTQQYFLSLQSNSNPIDNKELVLNLTTITSSIILASDEKTRRERINFLIFWVNYIIDCRYDSLNESSKSSIANIINNLDLCQLDCHLDLMGEDDSLLFNIETRKLFDKELILTDSQIDIMFAVLNSRNIVFSAPTSYGKSSIIVNSIFLRLFKKEINNVIFVLPSKALINEYRKKINKLISVFDYKITVNENPYIEKTDNQNIHLFTQERVLIFEALNSQKIDYVVFDEVQELLSIVKKAHAERAVLLAKSISLYENKNVPMVFLMPYIRNPEEDFLNFFTNIKFFVKKDLYSPTTSNKYLITRENDTYYLNDVTKNKGFDKSFATKKLDVPTAFQGDDLYDIKFDFYNICCSLDKLEEKTLCYCKKDHTSSIAEEFQKNSSEIPINGRLASLIKYLENYVHPDFELISFLKKGIAIHHADLDTFTKRQIEECFKSNEYKLNFIFCTSTLLQGVNLNANNLFFFAKRGSFTNAELDKKNLFGRVGRIGSKLQGNIYKFWVEGERTKKETVVEELNTSGEQYQIKEGSLFLSEDLINSNELVKSYYQDKDIRKKLNTSSPVAIEKTEIDNFDYFIGKDSSCKIDKKINKMPQSEKNKLEERLKFSTYEDCEYVMEKLSEIYDWKNSKNIDEKYRMTSIKYMATVFYNNFFGVSIKNSINSMIALNKKSEDYVLAIMKTNTQDAKLYPKILKRSNYSSVRNFVRLYEDSDINLLIYSYIYETQNIIEFRVKKYLQDLYYRLLKSKNRQIKSIEDYLIYSVSNNDKKINLNKLGLIDSFAIDELTLKSELFDGNTPNIHRMKEYANSLNPDEPLRYAILDVIV